MTYEEVKSYLGKEDLVSLLEGLGYEFNRNGKFDIRGEKTPSVSINPKDLKIKDFGGDFSGDVFDLLKKLHGMRQPEDLKYVMNFLGLSEDPAVIPVKRKVTAYVAPPKDNAKLMSDLKVKAQKYLSEPIIHNGRERKRYQSFEYEYETIRQIVSFDQMFIKLFEQSFIEMEEARAAYIFENFVGYDSYFNCPAIIVKDLHGNVVNIVKYRPKKDSKECLKYLYLKAEETPNSDYLYPFQYEMEKMMMDFPVCYVGEGLKNALVALAFGSPYISIESASGATDGLVRYLKSGRMSGVHFIAAFDGDAAGERAYKKMNKYIPMENLFEFDSGMDFADYMKKEKVA